MNENIVWNTDEQKFQKYSLYEIRHGINFVNGLLNNMGFSLYTIDDHDNTEHQFKVIDLSGRNFENIENESFSTLEDIIFQNFCLYRLIKYYTSNNNMRNEVIHSRGHSNLLRDSITKENINKKISMLIDRNYFMDLLQNITPSIYEQNIDFLIDPPSYEYSTVVLLDKDIALKILNSQKQCNLVQIGNVIYYESEIFNSNNELKDFVLSADKHSIFSYKQQLMDNNIRSCRGYYGVFNMEKNGILHDLCVYGTENFYLSKVEFEYIGLSDEYEAVVEYKEGDCFNENN